MDRLINLNIDDGAVREARHKTVMNTLVQQIIKGNVIPVLGNEMVKINGVPSSRFLLEAIARKVFGITEPILSYTALLNHQKYKAEGNHRMLYNLAAGLIEKNPELFAPTGLLEDFLSIKYFPFIITTTFDPAIENTMRKIHKDKLRVLSFVNDPVANDDIGSSMDTTAPTLYYMFGKANDKGSGYVLSDMDLLKFSRSWLQPNDNSSRIKPANLANALAGKYLLVLGNDFQDWLFRFFWFAMKEERLNDKGLVPNGMEASEHSDEQLIEFLNYSNITSEISDLAEFVAELKARLAEAEPSRNTGDKFDRPEMNADVFISYSRADSDVAETLYRILSEKGVNVWYDRNNLGIADDFRKEIRNSIRTCRLFVPVLSGNITKQAAEEHIYRLEWLWAIEHKRLISSSVDYLAPLAEKGFNLYDHAADIEEEIRQHNAAFYSNASLEDDLGQFADKICETLKRKQNG